MTVATFAAAQLLRVLPRTRITRAVGRLCDAKAHPLVIETVVGLYVKAYRVDLDEAADRAGFASFDDFFTRRLREGARPECADANAFVSPADGRLEDIGPVRHDGVFHIKGNEYRAVDLVGDAEDARRYEGGQFAIVYLSPRDYHRVHSPVAGNVSLVRSMRGDLFPVNSIGERHIQSLFSINRRVAIVVDTPNVGRVTVVMVGAMIVGRITVPFVEGRDVPFGDHRLSPAVPVGRGDEIGIFHLGSTAVVFAEKGNATWRPLEAGPKMIRVGEPFSLGGPRSPQTPRSEREGA